MGHQLDLVSYGSKTRLDFLVVFQMGPCMVWVWGGVFKLKVMDRTLGFPSCHHSSFLERDTRLSLLCVLDYQLKEHDMSDSGVSVG